MTISLLTLPRARCFTPRVRVLQQSTGLRIGPNGRTSPTAIAIHVNVARETDHDGRSPTVENQSAVGSQDFKADGIKVLSAYYLLLSLTTANTLFVRFEISS